MTRQGFVAERIAAVLRAAESVSRRVRRRLENGSSPARRSAAPAGDDGSGYTRVWQPRSAADAMQLILVTRDEDVFDEHGRGSAALVRELVGPSSVVLDIGCGIGRVARHVAPHVKMLVALDISPQMLELAAQHLAGIDNIRLQRSAPTTLTGVGDGSIDVAYAMLVLQHVEREDAFLLLREVRRVLRPGGQALISFPNLLDDGYLASLITYAETGETANPARARFYTPQEVERIVPAAGLVLDQVQAGPDIMCYARRPAEATAASA